jgi:hypothetical protein
VDERDVHVRLRGAVALVAAIFMASDTPAPPSIRLRMALIAGSSDRRSGLCWHNGYKMKRMDGDGWEAGTKTTLFERHKTRGGLLRIVLHPFHATRRGPTRDNNNRRNQQAAPHCMATAGE